MWEIICPNTYRAEREYIIFLLMNEFFGMDYRLVWSDKVRDKTIFRRADKTIILYDVLFQASEAYWLKEQSLPRQPLALWNVSLDFPEITFTWPVPLIYMAGVLRNPVRIGETNIEFDLDVLGSCFFMLTRYEEIVKQERDEHGRFPATESLAYQEGFLERPIVNEYIEILWTAVHRLFPDIKRKQRRFRLIPTHDIDHPFGMAFESFMQILRHSAGDFIIRKSLSTAWERLKDLWELHFHRERYVCKKKETFTFLYEMSRKHGLKDMYFFMDSKCSRLDGNYTVSEPEIKTLIREIHAEGHELGLHPSYVSCMDTDELFREVAHVKVVYRECGIHLLVGARQHYLRWQNPDTWNAYEEAGILVDSSIGFADKVGFRCGICYEYPVFDLIAHRRLRLREKPLIVMDGTLTEYMQLSEAEAMQKVLTLAKECMRYSGDFVILWHNTTLDNEENQVFYKEMIERILEQDDSGETSRRGK